MTNKWQAEDDNGAGLHVAIIMDGNGRWAAARGLPRTAGHRAGRAAVVRTVQAALAQDIRVLTLFTFSTENWGRPETEVCELMETFEDFFRTDAVPLAAHGIRITAIGRRDRLPMSLREAVEQAEQISASGESLRVRFAIDYSGRDAILRAARRLRDDADDSAGSFSRLLAAAEPQLEPIPDVDLLIRTGGELRLSNCPLWEIAYAELYFTPCLWPDFDTAQLEAALEDFSHRDRRFGCVSAGAPY